MNTFAFSFEDAQPVSWWRRLLDALSRMFARFKAFLTGVSAKTTVTDAGKADDLLAEKLKDPKTKEEAITKIDRLINHSENVAYLVRYSIGTQQSVLNKDILAKLKIAVGLVHPKKIIAVTMDDVKKIAINKEDMQHAALTAATSFKDEDTARQFVGKSKPFTHLANNKPWEAELKEIDSLNDELTQFLEKGAKDQGAVRSEVAQALAMHIALLVGGSVHYAKLVNDGINQYNALASAFLK